MRVPNMLHVTLCKCERFLLTFPRPGTLPRDVDRHGLPSVGLSNAVGGSAQGLPSNNHIDYPIAGGVLTLDASLSVALIPPSLLLAIGTICPPRPLSSSIRAFALCRQGPSRRRPSQWTPLVALPYTKPSRCPCYMSFSIARPNSLQLSIASAYAL
ncbi:hypothetical protein CRG98_025893 [Punica granatum]|uniref:Uncharacterized protein n=1 Tax=Punica granatum TaxID=22663 RepID=A0A2I0JBL9_PUNGR|nr:hypothetical protein CRG98_025893 [Punica granatum]